MRTVWHGLCVLGLIGVMMGIETSALEPANGERPVDLLLVAGQSNAVGFDADPAQLPSDPDDAQTMLWYRIGDPPADEHDAASDGWMPLAPQPRGNPISGKSGRRQFGNFGQPAGGFGPEIGWVRALRAAEERELAVVKVAYNGTSLDEDWNPDAADARGLCYPTLVTETRRAVAAAHDQGVALRPRALLWVQGESDATEEAAPHYARRLSAMIAALRHDLEAPDLVVLLAVNTQFSNGKNVPMSRIVEAQQAVAAEDPRCVYIDTSSVSVANTFHFDAAGTLDVGRAAARALREVEAPGSHE